MRLPPADLDRLKTVARALAPLDEKVVFLGGAVVKGGAYEMLLEKNAEDVRTGAG